MDKLPNDWELVSIGEIAKTTAGGTPSRSKADYWNGTIPWLKSGELNDLLSIESNSEFITEQGLNNSSAKLFPKGTLLIAMYGATAGKLGVLGIDASTNQAVCSIQNVKGLFENKYLFYNLLFNRERIIIDSTGGAQPNISKKYIDSFQIPLPPLPEQKSIVSKLDALFERIDKSIALLEENIKQTEHLMASALDEVFRDLIKSDNQVELNHVCVFKNGYAFKSKDFNENGSGIQVLRIGNVLNKAKNPVYIEENPNYEKALLQKDDIIISLTGTRTKQDYLFVSLIDEKKYYLNQRVGAISTKENMFFKFLYFFLQTSIFRQDIFQFETGTVNQGNISGKDILRMQIPLPSIDKQIVLSERMEELTKKISGLNEEQITKLTNLKSLKESILNKAFKGEL